MRNIKILLFLICILQVNAYGMNFIIKSKNLSKKLLFNNSKNLTDLEHNLLIAGHQQWLPEQENNENITSNNENNNDYIPIKLPDDESALSEKNENNGYIPITEKLTRENGTISPANNLPLPTPNSSKQLSSKEYLLDSCQREKQSYISYFCNELSCKDPNNTIFTTKDIIIFCNFIKNENLTNLSKFFHNFAEQKIKIISLNPKLTRFTCLHKTNRACNSECEINKITLIEKLNKLKTEIVDEKYIRLVGLHELSEYITKFVTSEIEKENDRKLTNFLLQQKIEHEKNLEEINTNHQNALNQKETEKNILQKKITQHEKTLKKYDKQLKKIRNDNQQSLEKIEYKHNATFALILSYLLVKNFENRKKSKTIFSELDENMKQQQKEYSETLQQKEIEYEKSLKKQEEKFRQKPPWYKLHQRYPRITYSILGFFTCHVISDPYLYICLGLRCVSFFLRGFASFAPKET